MITFSHNTWIIESLLCLRILKMHCICFLLLHRVTPSIKKRSKSTSQTALQNNLLKIKTEVILIYVQPNTANSLVGKYKQIYWDHLLLHLLLLPSSPSRCLACTVCYASRIVAMILEKKEERNSYMNQMSG